ncbi:MAG: VanZ family protein [Candidatus Omnitrophica bacterium]|nr:VanZ family protein [Candidatus Omnitrophota bacterium]
MRKFIKFWIPVILYMGLIFWFSSLSKLPKVPPLPYLDKAIHTLEYTLLGILLLRAFKNYGFRKKFLWTISVGLIYAITDEIHQYFVPFRESSVLDILFDTLGILLGANIFVLTSKR